MERTVHSVNTMEELFAIGANQKVNALLLGAPWNQGTRVMEDRLEQLLQSHDDYGIGYSNIEDSQELALKFGVKEFPSLLFLSEKGDVILATSGVLSQSGLENKFSEALISSGAK